jgi:hypothetical protein
MNFPPYSNQVVIYGSPAQNSFFFCLTAASSRFSQYTRGSILAEYLNSHPPPTRPEQYKLLKDSRTMEHRVVRVKIRDHGTKKPGKEMLRIKTMTCISIYDVKE